MECSPRIIWWRKCLLLLLLALGHRGLSAQEFDLYDYRYYKRFESVEELMKPEEKEPNSEPIFRLNPTFSTRLLDYNFSAIRFARRGLHLYGRRTTINGVEIPFVGVGSMSGLQLETKQHYGISESGVGGEMKLRIDTAIVRRTDIRARFASYNMPYSISASTAQRFNGGWGVAANMVLRTGRDLFVNGLFGNSVAVNAIATKSFGEQHTLALALFVEPSMRSTRQYSTAEAFRLTGNNLYNPSWGYQDGKVRNSHIRRELMPCFVLSYEGVISKRTKIALAASLTAGVERYSSLEWFDAQTPMPDNYRYMPSYFADEEDIFLAVESAWLNNDTRYTQIDFDRLISTNCLNKGHAIYAISDRVERSVRGVVKATLTTELKRGYLSYGLEVAADNRRHYKQMRDLLGADYIIDLDYFLLDDDTFGNSLQNSLATPNRHIVEGDRFGYDYAMRRNTAMAFVGYRYNTERLSLDLLAKVGYTDISRRGFYRKELFADNSFGISSHLDFAPYLLYADAKYRLHDNHLFGATISLDAKAVDTENLFLQSQYNNRIVNYPTMRKSYGAELSYMFQRPRFSLSATLFALATIDDGYVQHLYDDLKSCYADVVVSGVDIVRYGVEVEAEYRFANNFRATMALCGGRYAYTDNATVSIYSDASNTLLVDNVESHTRYLTLGNAPQIAATAGLSYYNRGWWAALSANYATLRYAEPSVVMRTERILATAISPEQRSELLAQERLRDAFTLDLRLSKSLRLERFDKRPYRSKIKPRFTDKYPLARIVFSVGVRNLLGSKSIVHSARESSRLQRYKLADSYIYSRQATRYLYAYPRTYEASISLRF